MKFRTRHMALILSVAAVAAAGCGSSSSSKTTAAPTPATPSTPSTTGTTTTAGGFSAQLEALCKQVNATATSTDLPTFAKQVEPYIAKFEALMPPAAQKADYEKFLTNAKQTVAAAQKNDQAQLQKLEAESKGLGAKLGAPTCDK